MSDLKDALDYAVESTRCAGNAAALREAVIKALTLLHVCDWPSGVSLDGVGEVIREIDSALDKPPRNCDMGTLTEQQQRFRDFCEKMQHTDRACCGGCPIVYLRVKGVIGNSCELAWAQMPYAEKGEAK